MANVNDNRCDDANVCLFVFAAILSHNDQKTSSKNETNNILNVQNMYFYQGLIIHAPTYERCDIVMAAAAAVTVAVDAK